MRRMTRTEILDAALKKSEQAVKLLDRAVEEVLADDVVKLAERVDLRMQSSCHTCMPLWSHDHGN